ncbi:hypothetical protein BU25DRAFT_420378 [Macroventuria anomochaeta]|uniref:Uncharacterized protein n=1 Tax=Macroventuria anomochaeta TaxID=301207 RepID=A0ACB6S4H2_9PLEO|nr:uncharacterized protein BU25DRAFT_420378 [Macroventuria anomochaeta]KAF2628939.1 hypothetical protein BU25DRAFT_420378 [Macroventuria anomochaeta]
MSSHARNLRIASEIRRADCLADVPCNRCFFEDHKCYIMPDESRRLKCAECTRAGKPCVNMSWASLDRTREEYEKKVQEDEALLATVISRLLRNKKILKQANECAKAKAMCLASEMIESGELDMAEDIVDCPVRTIGMSLSPTVWTTLGYIEDAVERHSTPLVVPGSS